jgi:WD40 repeat protein
VGTAEIAVAFDSWNEGRPSPSHQFVTISAPRTNVKSEPVSKRLKQELMFPVRGATILTLHFSPDGRRLLAGSYPAGTVQLFDVETGKQHTKIETGRNGGTSFFVAPDWKTLYASLQTKRSVTSIENDGKRLNRWECEGEVRAWDLDNGDLKETFKNSPPRGILSAIFSPDGHVFATYEELSGETDRGPIRGVTLWNVATRDQLQLGNVGVDTFSRDSRLLAISAIDKDNYATSINLLDSDTGRVRLSIPIAEKLAWANVTAFAPDGNLMIGNVTVFQARNNWQNSRTDLRFWDTATGKELASFSSEVENDRYLWPTFSPDGRTLVASNYKGAKSQLYFFDVAERKLARTAVLGDKCGVSRPVFSPNGKWFVVIAQAMTGRPNSVDTVDPRDSPQARIHIINVATGEIRETIIAPPGFPATACFSPDGATLATGGHGRVLLWDVSDLTKSATSSTR